MESIKRSVGIILLMAGLILVGPSVFAEETANTATNQENQPAASDSQSANSSDNSAKDEATQKDQQKKDEKAKKQEEKKDEKQTTNTTENTAKDSAAAKQETASPANAETEQTAPKAESNQQNVKETIAEQPEQASPAKNEEQKAQAQSPTQETPAKEDANSAKANDTNSTKQEAQETTPAKEAEAASDTDSASESSAGEAAVSVSKKAEDKKKESKFWSLSLTYQFMHNVAKERPTATNVLSIDPSFKLPYKFRLSLHFGASWSIEYDRTTTTNDESGWTISNPVDNKDFHTVDMDVTVVTLSRSLFSTKIKKKLSIFTKGALSLYIPYTSKFSGVVPKWYFAYKPSISAGIGFAGFRLSDSVSFQQNFHGEDFRLIEQGGAALVPAVQYKVANKAMLTWSKWGISASFVLGTTRSWRYRYDLGSLYDEAESLEYPVSEKVSWSYSGEIGYSFAALKKPVLDKFSVMLGITTAGPERRNGGFGDDRVYPLDPLFTSVYFGINATL